MDSPNFALQWLEYLGVEIHNKGKRILKYKGEPNYEIIPLRPYIEIGKEFDEMKDAEYQVMGFTDFVRLGFIIKIETTVKWRKGQRIAYRIVKKNRNVIGLNEDSYKRAGIKVQHDPTNRRLRLVGLNVMAVAGTHVDSGVGPWFSYDEDKPKELRVVETNADYMRARWNTASSIEGSNKKYIKEIPIGIADEGYVVCVPKNKNYCQRIIVVGASGTGKSLVVNNCIASIYYSEPAEGVKDDDCVGVVADPLNQFYNISLPNDVKTFNMFNKLISRAPTPLPAIQFYLASKYSIQFDNPNISFTLSLPFSEFINKYKFFVHDIKDYDVGNTIKYMNLIKEKRYNEFLRCSSGDDIMNLMYQTIPNMANDKGMQAMGYKWKGAFDEVFKDKFTSNLYTYDINETHEFTVKYPDGKTTKGHPFIMSMEAGLIPVINISKTRKERYVRNYLANLMQKIYQHQANLGKNQRRLWLIFDELNEIYEKGKKRDKCTQQFIELFRQGRFNNIGFIGNTQSLDKLEEDMYKNANYIFSTYLQKDSERKVFKDFQIDKEVYDMIGNLQPLEMILFRSPGDPFILYDRWGTRSEIKGNDRRWFKVKIFPPVNHHSASNRG